jgi:hypothetical protein
LECALADGGVAVEGEQPGVLLSSVMSQPVPVNAGSQQALAVAACQMTGERLNSLLQLTLPGMICAT